MNRLLISTVYLCFLSLTLNCSGSQSQQNRAMLPGDAMVVVSGSVDSELEGEAHISELHLSGNNSWFITLIDPDTEIFSIRFSLDTSERVYWPGPGIGEYEIGAGEKDSGTFSVTYYHLQAGASFDPETGEVISQIPAYSSKSSRYAGGKLMIEEITDHYIKGSFRFTAHRITNPDSDDIITAEGRFIAEPQTVNTTIVR